MDPKDAKIIKALTELGLRDQELTPEQEEIFQRAKNPEAFFLDDVKKLFEEPLTELFQNKLEWKWTEIETLYSKAEVDLPDERPLDIYFEKHSNHSIPSEIILDHPQIKNEALWHIVFDVDRNLGITGSGQAFIILSVVIDIINDFVRKVDPKVLYFTSKEPSRVKLYTRLLSKFKNTASVYTYPYLSGKKFYIVRD